jgi:hypothetical protein
MFLRSCQVDKGVQDNQNSGFLRGSFVTNTVILAKARIQVVTCAKGAEFRRCAPTHELDSGFRQNDESGVPTVAAMR